MVRVRSDMILDDFKSKMNMKIGYATLGAVVVAIMGVSVFAQDAGNRVQPYNVIWKSPSVDASGQMPLGNGDIAAGVYAIENGALYLLLAKNDAFNYNGDIFKTGRVKIELSPNPFAHGKPFRQVLDLKTGSIRIDADGVAMRIWADASRPIYHVQIDSPSDVTVRANSDLWERIDGCAWNSTMAPIDPPTQDVRLQRDGKILWYFSVGDRSAYAADLAYYNVEQMAAEYPDPYRFNTFGNLLESPDLRLQDSVLRGSGKVFDIRIHALAMQSPKVADWIEAIEHQAARPIDVTRDWAAHCHWWSEFWDRSWITVTDNTLPADQRGRLSHEGYTRYREVIDGGALVAQSYNVFRFLMACQSRGRIQTKFNGGLFTQPLRYPSKPRLRAIQQADGQWISHEDDRLWGRRFTYQNQRLLYWPLLMSGDYEMMQPFFHYYSDLLPIRKAITKAWFGHEGAYYRENIEPTGGERDCGRTGKPPKTKPGQNKGEGYYHSYYFTCGLETVAMMIDYVKYSDDAAFRDQVLVPFARAVLQFFDQHYGRDPDGKIRLDPAMVLETWWIAVNPAPDVAGLQHCLDQLLAMGVGTATDHANWKRFRHEIPEVHLHEIEGRMAIAPARSWEKKKNAENGELYPVFPFRCFGLGFSPESRDIVEWTMQHRTLKNAFGYKCWTQDQIHWAYAGNAAEAQDGLVHRFQNASPLCRFSLYGSEGPDSCPDFDHFGSGSIALQRMLVQEAGDKILLLPAWPASWDANFRLHVAQQTTISGKITDGKLMEWTIEPAARRNNVIVYQPQAIPERPVVPHSDHPLRLGVDSNGGSRFQGRIGRATMFRGVMTPDVIKRLATGDRSEILTGATVVRCLLDPKAGDVLPTKPGDFEGAVSFEAWIQPAKREAGRIFDKLTAGQRDGFLIDCWPDLSLRIILGSRQDDFPAVLHPGVWQHVAVVMGTGRLLEVYLNGNKLQRR
jgi:alpha-L-fucosidase 2